MTLRGIFASFTRHKKEEGLRDSDPLIQVGACMFLFVESRLYYKLTCVVQAKLSAVN